MKQFSFVLLALCFALPLRAQTAVPASTTTPPPPLTANPHVKAQQVMRPPLSIRPSTQARLSTAQRMAALNNRPPLQELPSFTASDRDGKAITPRAMAQPSHWLLIYRSQNCLPCDRLMNVLAASESPDLKGGKPYVILVAGKTSDGLERVKANFSPLSEATWLADKDAQAYAALKPRGTPVVYAMSGMKIAWKVPGNLGNPAKVEKMAAAWIANGGTAFPNSVAPTPNSNAK
jgi:hypothetical protein